MSEKMRIRSLSEPHTKRLEDRSTKIEKMLLSAGAIEAPL
jgi:hypothetical protein